MTKITGSWLYEHSACAPGIRWWKRYGSISVLKTCQKLCRQGGHNEQRVLWMKWLLERVLRGIYRTKYDNGFRGVAIRRYDLTAHQRRALTMEYGCSCVEEQLRAEKKQKKRKRRLSS